MIKFILALVSIVSFQAFASELDFETAQQMIEARQFQVTKKEKIKVLSIEAMTEHKGSTLYRVNVKFKKGEQTYQVRYPQKSKDGITDVIWTTSIYNQPTTAKDVKLSEAELAEFIQIATDAGYNHVRKEFPDMKITGLYTFAHGEVYREPKAVITTFQVFYKKMSVPLLRRVDVTREAKKARVGYAD